MSPGTAEELRELVSDASRDGRLLRIRGGGSKDKVGAPAPDASVLDMRGFTGVIDYDPAELVLTARAGTPLAEIQALVASRGQMLGFDPFDHGLLLGGQNGTATIGGVVAAGVSGPARLTCGAVRDHLLGFVAVSGHGEVFKAGAKVVKNVTGFDLSKLISGSWGRLAAITELSLKVVPRPKMRQTLLLHDLSLDDALTAMAHALGSAADLSAAAHLQDWGDRPVTALRLDGFPASVAARLKTLKEILGATTAIEILDDDASSTLWDDIRDVALLPKDLPLWRIVLPPSQASVLLASLEPAEWQLDWAGGLVWLTSSQDPTTLRAASAAVGGHAMLIRADRNLRQATPTFHPLAPAVAALETAVRRAFDPVGLFEMGRF